MIIRYNTNVKLYNYIDVTLQSCIYLGSVLLVLYFATQCCRQAYFQGCQAVCFHLNMNTQLTNTAKAVLYRIHTTFNLTSTIMFNGSYPFYC